MRSYFFMSHAAADDGDSYVARFHADLRREVGRQLGDNSPLTTLDASEISDAFAPSGVPGASRGFDACAGRENEAGRFSPPRSTPAMSCPSLVALYSADYLRSQRCAYDRSLFEERMAWESHRTGRPSAALVDVVWDPSGLPAEPVGGSSRLPGAVGGDYPRRGLAQLMRDPSAYGGYAAVLRRVAEQVARGVRRPPPTMTPRDIWYFARSARNPTGPAPAPDARLPSATVKWQSVDGSPVGQISVVAGMRSGSRWAPTRPAEQPDPLSRPRSWFSSPEEAQRPILRGPHM